MSVLVVGISHSSAPVELLERVALTEGETHKLVHDVASCEHVTEATVISTCNRVEIYTDVDRFHGSVEMLSRLLMDRAGEPAETMLPHLYVHYDDGAVSHLFQVAAGLDSMAVGEGQILGQTRSALRVGQELGTVGPSLNLLFQQALRVGKRSRAESGIDRVAPTLVSAALERSARAVGPVTGRDAVVVGAGSMAGLAVATLVREGAARVTVLNRSPDRAQRLALEHAAVQDPAGALVRALPLASLPEALAEADLVITCTGAAGVMVTEDAVARARLVSDRGAEHPLAVLDLALPRDVEPSVGDLPGVDLVGLAELAATLAETEVGREVELVRGIVTDEVTAFVAARRQASVTPTVIALRTMATAVVDAEMARLDARLPALGGAERAEVLHAVRRVADKLLHEPTVRVRELADQQGAVSYAAALAELFALDPEAVDAVTRPQVSEEGPS